MPDILSIAGDVGEAGFLEASPTPPGLRCLRDSLSRLVTLTAYVLVAVDVDNKTLPPRGHATFPELESLFSRAATLIGYAIANVDDAMTPLMEADMLLDAVAAGRSPEPSPE